MVWHSVALKPPLMPVYRSKHSFPDFEKFTNLSYLITILKPVIIPLSNRLVVKVYDHGLGEPRVTVLD